MVASIWYCLAVIAAKTEYEVRIHEVLYMSNHVHIVATFDDDSMPDFMQDLNSLVSRQLNALRGRTGSNFEPHFNAVEIADPDKILDHCAYTLANPCAAHLVTRAEGWRGVTSVHMEYGKPVTIQRPLCGLWNPKRAKSKKRPQAKKPTKPRRGRKSAGRAKYAGRSKLPDAVELTLARPPGFDELTREGGRRKVAGRHGDPPARVGCALVSPGLRALFRHFSSLMGAHQLAVARDVATGASDPSPGMHL